MNTVLLAFTVLAGYMLFMFSLSIIKKDNSIVDIAYGPAFIVVTLVLYLNQFVTPSIRSSFVAIAITIWGLRLAYRIGKKNWGKPEDFRYAAWREEWNKKGKLYFYIRSFFQVFVLQGIIIFLVSMPSILGHTMQVDSLRWFHFFGMFLWLFGFLFEAVGDYQLDKFLKEKKLGKTKKEIMTTGLWKYTRHPNYFGESMQWWGLAIVLLFSVKYSLLVFISPIIITYLLIKVSGIPMLEKRWEGEATWESYKRKTNAFLPWIPNKAIK